MVTVCLLAIVATVLFLYLRFDSVNSRFREGTLLSYATLLAQDLDRHPAATPGKAAPATAAGPDSAVVEQITSRGGRFAVVSGRGELISASPGVTAPLVPTADEVQRRYFTLRGPGPDDPPDFGLSLPVPGISPPIFAQVAFPNDHVLFDSVLEEFVSDIAWIWLPFLVCILAMNIAVARIALRPLRIAARHAEAIGPGSVAARMSEENLPGDVRALVHAINMALERLQQGYLALEDFVADVAHELRTPLAIIKAQLASVETPAVRSLESEVSAMERLVQQLLDRIRLGGIHFESDSLVDLADLARETARYMAPLAVVRGRSIELLEADESVTVAGARDFLGRALRNLVENAIEHAPPGTTVTVSLAPGPKIRVLDRGPGFPAARLGPRPARLRSDRRDGLGLGLWIVQRTMEAHGGRLRLANRPNGGACAVMDFATGQHRQESGPTR